MTTLRSPRLKIGYAQTFDHFHGEHMETHSCDHQWLKNNAIAEFSDKTIWPSVGNKTWKIWKEFEAPGLAIRFLYHRGSPRPELIQYLTWGWTSTKKASTNPIPPRFRTETMALARDSFIYLGRFGTIEWGCWIFLDLGGWAEFKNWNQSKRLIGMLRGMCTPMPAGM